MFRVVVCAVDLRVPCCGLCFWICVFLVVVYAFGFACSVLWFVLLDLRVPCCGLCFSICVFRVVCAVDLRVPCCGLCCWICMFCVVLSVVGARCFVLCLISRHYRRRKQTTR